MIVQRLVFAGKRGFAPGKDLNCRRLPQADDQRGKMGYLQMTLFGHLEPEHCDLEIEI